MADQELLKKLQAQMTQDPDKEDDAVPYDPNGGTLTNIGRFLANNAMSKSGGMSGMMPVAGAVKAVAAAPELAEGAVAMGKNIFAPIVEQSPAIAKAIESNPESVSLGRNVWAPINSEAPLTTSQLKDRISTLQTTNPNSGEIDLLTRKLNNLQDMIARRNRK